MIETRIEYERDGDFEYAKLFIKMNEEEERVYRAWMRPIGSTEWKDPMYFLSLKEIK